jgi:hypothetical protein
MKLFGADVNGTKCRFGIIEAGEKAKSVREALGIEYSADTSLVMRGEDFEDVADLEHSFPETYRAFKAAGVNFATMRGFIEVRS